MRTFVCNIVFQLTIFVCTITIDIFCMHCSIRYFVAPLKLTTIFMHYYDCWLLYKPKQLLTLYVLQYYAQFKLLITYHSFEFLWVVTVVLLFGLWLLSCDKNKNQKILYELLQLPKSLWNIVNEIYCMNNCI